MVGEVFNRGWARGAGVSKLGLFLCAVISLSGCGGGSTITVTVSPKTASLRLQSNVQFAYSITPSSDTAGVKWYVNDTLSGNSTIGTIDTTGKYTAPTS